MTDYEGVDMSNGTRGRSITIQEAAEMLGVSPWTVRRRITDGTIKAIRVGRLIRIPEDLMIAGLPPVTAEES